MRKHIGFVSFFFLVGVILFVSFYSTINLQIITEHITSVPPKVTQEKLTSVINDLSGNLNKVVSEYEKETDMSKKQIKLNNISTMSNSYANSFSSLLTIQYPSTGNDAASLLKPYELNAKPSDTTSLSNFLAYINKNNIINGVLSRIISIQTAEDASIVINDINNCNKLVFKTIFAEIQKITS